MQTRRKFFSSLAASSAAFFFLKEDALTNIQKIANDLPANYSSQLLAEDEEFWGVIQSSFDVDRSMVNLNNGGVSPSPRQVISVLKNYIDYSNQAPSYYMWRHLEPNLENVRKQIANSFGCDKEEIAITRNASEALENIQLGLKLTEGDEIITTTQDYPRMITTWEQRRRRDKIVIKKVKYPTPLNDPKILINNIEKEITSKTKIIHISHICFLTGQVIPVKEISQLAHSKNIEVICDAAHSFNHIPFKHSDLECDYMGTSLHKWTYAPIGTGFLFIKKDKIKNVWPLFAADEKIDNDIRKFEEIGTHPAANHNAIAEAISFNNFIGIERKAERLRYLHKIWINKIKNFSGVKFLVDISNETNWAGLVNLSIDGVDPNKLANYLFEKHRIFVVAIVHDEYEGIRITPNVYTTVQEIKMFSDALEDILKNHFKDIKK